MAENVKEREFLVTYYECYSRGYKVKAANEEEAKEKLDEMIRKGIVDAPDNCYDSGYQVEKII